MFRVPYPQLLFLFCWMSRWMLLHLV